MKALAKRAILAWLIPCLLVLVWWLYTYFRADLTDIQKAESQVYVLLWMSVLTFPSGLAWAVLFSLLLGLLDSFGIASRPLPFEVVAMWVGFVATGLLQWFVYGPIVLAKFRAWRSSHGQ